MAHNMRALGGRRLAPPGEAGLRGSHGGIDIPGAGAGGGDPGGLGAGGGVDGRQRFAAAGGLPLAGDEQHAVGAQPFEEGLRVGA